MTTAVARRHLPICIIAIALIAGALILTRSPGVEAASSAAVSPIDTSSQDRVAVSFRRHVLDTMTVPARWTGSVESCAAGASSAAFDTATVEAINWFRAMAGLPSVVEDPVMSRAAQQAALMMDAQNELSHAPTRPWACHTAAGADAAGSSNLTLGVAGASGVVAQIEDPGAANDVLGHRRWLLFPRLQRVGIGNTDQAGVIQVIGSFGARPSGDTWIAWPPAGTVPDAVVFERWSLSFSGASSADFSSATVTMTENGRPVDVRMLRLVSGFGDDTLGWEPIGIAPSSVTPVTYDVTVSGVIVDGRSRTHRYRVISFDHERPAVGPALAVEASGPRCRGRLATILGTNGDDTIRGTSGRDVIVSFDGDDTIYGEGGNDIICSGAGNDVVHGGDGADIVLGGPGHDNLRGGGGRDWLHGQNGRDRLTGNQGNDTLSGGGNIDMLVGSVGTDACWAMTADAAGTGGDGFRSCERTSG